jgi:hypothetical protein
MVDWDNSESYSSSLLLHGNLAQQAINVYPNPSKDVLYFSGILNEPIQAKVCDLFGKTMIDIQLDASNTQINIESLPTGIYTLQLQNGSEISIQKIIKQ